MTRSQIELSWTAKNTACDGGSYWNGLMRDIAKCWTGWRRDTPQTTRAPTLLINYCRDGGIVVLFGQIADDKLLQGWGQEQTWSNSCSWILDLSCMFFSNPFAPAYHLMFMDIFHICFLLIVGSIYSLIEADATKTFVLSESLISSSCSLLGMSLSTDCAA